MLDDPLRDLEASCRSEGDPDVVGVAFFRNIWVIFPLDHLVIVHVLHIEDHLGPGSHGRLSPRSLARPLAGICVGIPKHTRKKGDDSRGFFRLPHTFFLLMCVITGNTGPRGVSSRRNIECGKNYLSWKPPSWRVGTLWEVELKTEVVSHRPGSGMRELSLRGCRGPCRSKGKGHKGGHLRNQRRRGNVGWSSWLGILEEPGAGLGTLLEDFCPTVVAEVAVPQEHTRRSPLVKNLANQGSPAARSLDKPSAQGVFGVMQLFGRSIQLLLPGDHVRERRLPVPATSTGLLSIVDNGPGNAEVPNMPDMRNVDPCTEERGRHDDLVVPLDETVVNGLQLADRPSVAVEGWAAQERRELFCRLVAPTEYQALLSWSIQTFSVVDIVHKPALRRSLVVEGMDVVRDLSSGSGSSDDVAPLQPERLQDLPLEVRRARSCHQKERNPWDRE